MDSNDSTDPQNHPNVFIGRQPIFDRNLKIYAYELLYRDSIENRANITDQNQSTSEVIINILTDFDFNVVTGNTFAFINLSRETFLLAI